MAIAIVVETVMFIVAIARAHTIDDPDPRDKGLWRPRSPSLTLGDDHER